MLSLGHAQRMNLLRALTKLRRKATCPRTCVLLSRKRPELAWLFMQSQLAVAGGPETRLSTELSGYIRDTLTISEQPAEQE